MMGRNILSVFVGLVVGFLFNASCVALNGHLFPAPKDFSWEDSDVVSAYFDALPLAAFLIVLVAHLGQSFFGGYVAGRISKDCVMMVAMIVGGLSLVGGIMNFMMLPLPMWMLIEMPLYLIVAWWAGNIAMKKRGTNTTVV